MCLVHSTAEGSTVHAGGGRTYSGLSPWAQYVDAGDPPFSWSAFCFCAGSPHVKPRLSNWGISGRWDEAASSQVSRVQAALTAVGCAVWTEDRRFDK